MATKALAKLKFELNRKAKFAITDGSYKDIKKYHEEILIFQASFPNAGKVMLRENWAHLHKLWVYMATDDELEAHEKPKRGLNF